MARSSVRGLLHALLAASVVVWACGGEATGASCEEQVTTQSGLKIENLRCGGGDKEADAGERVTVRYTGSLENGEEFDSGRLTFALGVGQVIEGWEEGLQGMKEGGKRRLVIPPELGYGEDGFPPVIPPNATLVFEVEMLKIRPAPD